MEQCDTFENKNKIQFGVAENIYATWMVFSISRQIWVASKKHQK
jgi:hypothetical protein